jgi:hypothetical protein
MPAQPGLRICAAAPVHVAAAGVELLGTVRLLLLCTARLLLVVLAAILVAEAEADDAEADVAVAVEGRVMVTSAEAQNWTANCRVAAFVGGRADWMVGGCLPC